MILLAALLGCSGCKEKAEEQQPNFIIIFDDQHNSKYMGWTGEGEGIRTPHMDELASRSVAFTNAYSTCPVCAPSRHSVYTGHYPSRHGVILNDMHLSEQMPTMMEILADEGYTTANIGKMHFGPYNARRGFQYVLNHEFFDNAGGISHFRPWLEKQAEERGLEAIRYPAWNFAEPAETWAFHLETLGFEYDLPVELTSEHWVSDEAINFMEDQLANRPGQPFFLHASYFAPHHPYGVTEEYNTYDPEDMFIPPSWSQEKAADFGKARRESFGLPPFSREDYQKLKAYYFGFISQLDHEIGRLVDWVDSQPELAENTIILFLGDHGDRMGEHGMLYKGGTGAMYEGSAAIPFMIRWPGQEARIEQTPVTPNDIMPTFLKAAGLEPDPELPGMDLKPLLESASSEENWQERVVFSEWLSPLPFRYLMARKGKYKFIADNTAGTFPDMHYELYDMDADKWEMNNLAYEEAYAEIVKDLKEEVMGHYERQKQYLPATRPPIVPRNVWDITFPFRPWEKTEAISVP